MLNECVGLLASIEGYFRFAGDTAGTPVPVSGPDCDHCYRVPVPVSGLPSPQMRNECPCT
jgi:hypothetical protein